MTQRKLKMLAPSSAGLSMPYAALCACTSVPLQPPSTLSCPCTSTPCFGEGSPALPCLASPSLPVIQHKFLPLSKKKNKIECREQTWLHYLGLGNVVLFLAWSNLGPGIASSSVRLLHCCSGSAPGRTGHSCVLLSLLPGPRLSQGSLPSSSELSVLSDRRLLLWNQWILHHSGERNSPLQGVTQQTDFRCLLKARGLHLLIIYSPWLQKQSYLGERRHQ